MEIDLDLHENPLDCKYSVLPDRDLDLGETIGWWLIETEVSLPMGTSKKGRHPQSPRTHDEHNVSMGSIST